MYFIDAALNRRLVSDWSKAAYQSQRVASPVNNGTAIDHEFEFAGDIAAHRYSGEYVR